MNGSQWVRSVAVVLSLAGLPACASLADASTASTRSSHACRPNAQDPLGDCAIVNPLLPSPG